MDIRQILEETGLSTKEANVYMAVLELGESTVLPISKKSGYKRTYCYDILSDLVEKGLVSFVLKNNRRRYKAEDPKKIRHKLNNHLILYESILPQLNTFYNNLQADKPRVSYYEGLKEIAGLYEEVMRAKHVDAISSAVHIEKFVGKYLKNNIDQIITKNTIMRELLPENSSTAFYHKYFIKPYHETRFIRGVTQLNTDMMIFDNKLVLISYGEFPHAVVIEDSGNVETQRIIFDLVWKSCGK